MKSLLTNLFRKKENSNWFEYIEFKKPIQVNKSSYKYSWVRISKQTNGCYTLVGYDPSYESSLTMGAQHRGVNVESFDEHEFERIRKLGKIKRFNFDNTITIKTGVITALATIIMAVCAVISSI